MSKTTDWQSIVNQADPEHLQNSLNPVEYEFTAPGSGPTAKPQIHENGLRVFRAGNYKKRGAYSDEAQ